MYERFTDRARKVMNLAHLEAQRLGHEYIGTEHMLLGLVKEGAGVAANVLKNMDVDLNKIRAEVEKIVQTAAGPFTDIGGKRPHTPRAKKAIEFSIEEARRLKHNYVGTEHLLLGLLREDQGVAAQVLMNLGLKLEVVRQEVLNLLGHNMEQLSEPERIKLVESTLGSVTPPVPAATPALNCVGRDLTALAQAGRLTPPGCWAAEVEQVIQALIRSTRNTPLLLSDSRAARTAVVECMAQRIAAEVIPAAIAGARVVTVDLETLVRTARESGQKDWVKALVADAQRGGNVLLVLEDGHHLMQEDSLFELTAALIRGQVRAVVAAQASTFYRSLAGHDALARVFREISIRPPTAADALAVLQSARDRHEIFHRVGIADAALTAAVELAGDYFPAQPLPDAALDLVDEATAHVRLQSMGQPPNFKTLDEQIEGLNRQKETAVAEGDFEKAAALRDQADQLKEQKKTISSEWRNQASVSHGSVDVSAVRSAVADRTGIAFIRSDPETAERLVRLESDLGAAVVGQPDAVAAVTRPLRARFAGLVRGNRPLGTFLFAGLPGTGKSLLAAQLARAVYGNDDAVIRIDLSGYATPEWVARLIDRSRNDGDLTGQVRRRPYSLVLLDHLDRAHPSAADLLLPLLEDGRLTDGAGRTIDFRTAVVVMTVTAGGEPLIVPSFGLAKSGPERDRHSLTLNLEQTFRPAFLARFDAVVPFRPLTAADLRPILDREIATLARRLAARGLTLTVAADAVNFLLDRAAGAEAGAHALQRTVDERLAAPLADAMLRGEFANGAVTVRVPGDQSGLEFIAQ